MNIIRKPKIIAIIGPTASGKSALGVAIARACNGEVVSADSRQFYKGMDIGTAKITPDEMQGVPHHLIDFLEPSDSFSLYDYQQRAYAVIDDILERGKVPIMVGGTGLYISSVIENYQLSSAGVDEELRQELHNLSDDDLVRRLLQFEKNPTIDLKNRRRVVRQLEYHLLDPSYEAGTAEPKYDVLILEPYYVRSELYSRINKRVKQMMEQGLLEEVDRLARQYGFEENALSAIGYREFKGLHDIAQLPPRKRADVAEEIKRNTRRYAKRQITWFKKYTGRKQIVQTEQEAVELAQRFLAD